MIVDDRSGTPNLPSHTANVSDAEGVWLDEDDNDDDMDFDPTTDDSEDAEFFDPLEHPDAEFQGMDSRELPFLTVCVSIAGPR